MSTSPLRRRSDHEPPDSGLMRALVVEDNDAYRLYIATLVRRYGFTVTQCTNGMEAVEVLRERTFDLVVADCEMPLMGGLELITHVRGLEPMAEVYAVMLTGRDDVETKLSALRLGYDDFLLKSHSELEIAAKLSVARRLVNRQRRLDSVVRELYGLATRDELTGLFNRRYFFAEAERCLAEGSAVNLVLFDLDDFKRINDTLGHLAGDRILRDVGSLFTRRTRVEDLVSRYGGDEFLMLVTRLEPDEVEALALRIGRELSAAQWTFGTESFSIGVTTGVACSSLLAKPTIAQLLSACDRDLYKNKWIRKHPNEDPSLYQYDAGREATVFELVDFASGEPQANSASE